MEGRWASSRKLGFDRRCVAEYHLARGPRSNHREDSLDSPERRTTPPPGASVKPATSRESTKLVDVLRRMVGYGPGATSMRCETSYAPCLRPIQVGSVPPVTGALLYPRLAADLSTKGAARPSVCSSRPRRQNFGSRLLSLKLHWGPLQIPSAAQSIRRKALIAFNCGGFGYDDEVGHPGFAVTGYSLLSLHRLSCISTASLT